MADTVKEVQQNIMIAFALIVAFLAVAALLLLPFGRGEVWLGFAKGYLVWWYVLVLATIALTLFFRVSRIDDDTHFDAYLLLNAAVSGVVVLGWAAFAALLANGGAAGAPIWLAAIIFALGLVSSHNVYGVVTMFYEGTFYRNINLPAALGGFVLFAAWPASARFLFGWFFGLF